jgi:hypothetical protein
MILTNKKKGNLKKKKQRNIRKKRRSYFLADPVPTKRFSFPDHTKNRVA